MDKKDKGWLIAFFVASALVAAVCMGADRFFMYIGVGVVTVGLPLFILYLKSK